LSPASDRNCAPSNLVGGEVSCDTLHRQGAEFGTVVTQQPSRHGYHQSCVLEQSREPRRRVGSSNLDRPVQTIVIEFADVYAQVRKREGERTMEFKGY